MAAAPVAAMGLKALGTKLLPFAIAALSSWFGGRRQNQAARRAHDARYSGNPRFQMRNALLTQLWNQHNLADRFKDAYPDPATYEAGKSYKTPENVLMAATSAPRFEGGGGPGLLDSLLGNIHRLPMPGSGSDDADPGLEMPAGGPPMPPSIVVDAQGDPLDPFALKLPTTIPFKRTRY